MMNQKSEEPFIEETTIAPNKRARCSYISLLIQCNGYPTSDFVFYNTIETELVSNTKVTLH